MATPYTTGPVHIFVAPRESFGGNAPVKYLGTCRIAPEEETRPEFEPIINDITGQRVPFDMMFVGEQRFTIGDLTRWNESVLAEIQARPSSPTNIIDLIANNGPGRAINGDIGSLMIAEGLAYEMWLRYEYGTAGRAEKAAMTVNNMPPGQHFLASWLVGPDIRRPGTRAHEVHLVWHHLYAYDPTTGNSLQRNGDMSRVANVPVD